MTLYRESLSRSTRSEEESDLSVSDLLRVIRRRTWLLGASAAFFLALATVYLVVAKRRFQADAELQLLSQKPSSSISDFAAGDSDTSALQLSVTMQTYVGILTSERLALQVIEELHLEQLPEFRLARRKDEENRPLAEAPHRREEVLRRFEKDLTVSPGSGSRLLNVSFRSTSPDVAKQVLNRLIEDFVAYNSSVRHSGSMRTETGLGKQLADLRKQVQMEEQTAQQAQHASGVYGTDASHNIAVARLEVLQLQLANAEQNRIVKGSVYDLVQGGNPEAISNLSNAPGQTSSPGGINSLALLETFHQREAELATQEAELASKFGSAYPPLVAVRKQLAALHQSMTTESKRLVTSAAGDYKAAVIQESGLRHEVEHQTALANQSNDAATRYLIANRQATATRDLYEHLLERSEELGVVAGLESDDVEVVDSAHVATSAKPAVLLTLLEGTGAGLVFGLCGVFLWDSMDQTVYAPDLAQKLSGIPLLGVVPLAVSKSAEPDPELTEAVRFIEASALMASAIQPKVLMITSASAGDGKSFMALKMASIRSRDGRSTLIVDADQRNGVLSRRLELTSRPGLAEMLGTPAMPDGSAYVQVIKDGVKVIPAGNLRPEYVASLASGAIESLLSDWKKTYDSILLVTAPLESASDALVLARLVDGVVMVCRTNVTDQTTFARACERLKLVKAPLIGTILNAAPRNSSEYQHYSGRKRNA